MKYLLRFSTHDGNDIYFDSPNLYTCFKKAILEKSKFYYITFFYKEDDKIKIKNLFINGLKSKS